MNILFKFLSKLLNILTFRKYRIYDTRNFNIYNKRKFDTFEKSHYLKVEKNKYLLIERPEGSYIENKLFKTSDITVDNSNTNWNTYWQNEEIIKEYLSFSRLDFFHNLIKAISNKLIAGNLIDIGCGTGDLLHLLKKSINSPFDFLGTDFSQQSIDYCKKTYSDITFETADIYSLHYNDNYFSNILSTEVIEHLIYPKKAIQEMIRICKPNGKIFISVPNSEIDDYIGHTNFWTIETLNAFLNEYKKEISLIDNNRTILCIIEK